MKLKKGFTLIELLVVISIIALLVAILMPALNKAKQQARSAVCMSNLKQWGTIWQMYTDEWNDKFPDYKKGQAAGMPRGSWIACLRSRYQKNPELLRCPSAVKMDLSAERSSNPGNTAGEYTGGVKHMFAMKPNEASLEDIDPTNPNDAKKFEWCSYGMNNWCMSGMADGFTQQRAKSNYWISRGNVKGGADVPVFADCKWRGGGPHYGTLDGNQSDNNGKSYRPYTDAEGGADGCMIAGRIGYDMEMGNFAMDRHGQGINVLFADASVRNVPVKQLWTLKWHRTYNRFSQSQWGFMDDSTNYPWMNNFPNP